MQLPTISGLRGTPDGGVWASDPFAVHPISGQQLGISGGAIPVSGGVWANDPFVADLSGLRRISGGANPVSGRGVRASDPFVADPGFRFVVRQWTIRGLVT